MTDGWKRVKVWFDDEMKLHMEAEVENPKFIDNMKGLGFEPGTGDDVIVGVAKVLPPGPPPPVLGKDKDTLRRVAQGKDEGVRSLDKTIVGEKRPGTVNVNTKDPDAIWLCQPWTNARQVEIKKWQAWIEELKEITNPVP